MRHPDAEKIVGQCEAALPAVLEAVGLSRATQWRPDGEGWVNVSWIGDEFVVRFNARDPDLPKIRREQWAYEALAERGFPVPRMIAHFDDPELSPYPVMVSERMPGENLEATWKTLSAPQQSRLTEQAGQWLARLHKVPFAGFGEIYGPQMSTQRAFWSEYTSGILSACEPWFDADDLQRLTTSIDAAMPVLDRVKTSWFVHRDYHFGNLLHDGTDIVGIFDFEWAMASDPAVDRVEWGVLDWSVPGARPEFERAYFAEYGPVSDDERLLALYALSGDLVLVDISGRFFTRPEFDENREGALAVLAQLERLL